MAGPLRAVSDLRFPSGPMHLWRQLTRDLHDGAQIIVERCWEIQFERKAGQLEVGGKQISCTVDAPAKLKALADIEQARREEGMFPLILSESGLIVSGGRERDDEALLAKAIAEARRMFAQSGQSLEREAQAARHLAQLQRASQPLLDTMPADLLFPTHRPIHRIEKVNLPNGSIGEFEWHYTAASVPETGWLDHAERQIITRTDGKERRSGETWKLTQA